MKSGTTALHDTLKRHPGVFMPRRKKEIHFFSEDENFRMGLEWYSRFFEAAPDGSMVGQTCPEYLFSSDAPLRILQHLPDIRLIFVLRDPVDRAWSHHWHNLRKGYGTPDFLSNLAFEQALGPRSSWEDRKRWGLVAKGQYFAQLNNFIRVIGRDQILLISSQRMKSEPQSEFDRICDFLGLDRMGLGSITGSSGFAQSNEGNWTPRFLRLHRLRPRLFRVNREWAERLDRWNQKPFHAPQLTDAMRAELWKRFEKDALSLSAEWRFDINDWKSVKLTAARDRESHGR